ncbi:GH92 family glycosyl hydrolase, partial [candidate division KSB1 bacterium]|nr:GH92 family glycosyl hydrolase [candidate division KSB1 bacterium]
QSERASPGIYRVTLTEPAIQVGLTATKHCGYHRYTFPRSDDAHILLDPGPDHRMRASTITIIDGDQFSGSIEGWGNIFFYGHCSKPFASFSIWDGQLHSGVRNREGKRVGAILNFKTAVGEMIDVKIGLSTVSVENARLNLQAEIPDWNFDGVAAKAKKSWQEMADKIDLQGDEEYKKIFYTALYHACQQPSDITDVNRQFSGLDKNTHTAADYTFYYNYAFWDDYRTKFPLMSLVNPAIFKDVVHSILAIYEQSADYWYYSNPLHTVHQGGFVVAGPDGFLPFITVRHEHMLTVVLDGYVKGLINEKHQQAYAGMRREIMVQMPEKYDAIGYIPTRPDQTFEYSYDNWCVAQMARLVGNEDDYRYFMDRAGYYRNTWDYSLGFLRARAENGQWLDFPESPALNREKYLYEGSPWQWRWFVPHDLPGMIEMMGGREKFVADLDYFFSNSLYQAANQPDIHAPFLFNDAGAAYLTQKWVRKLLTEPMTHLYGAHEFYKTPIFDRVYKATPDGYLLEMDDDYGCMASWYALSAMGLFQVCPGSPVYQLTAPIFDRVTIKLDAKFYPGKKFSIIARNLNPDNIYIQSATLNGKSYEKASISHQEIVAGGELVFTMGPEPNKNWGK